MDEVAITWVQLLVSGDCCLKSPASGAPDSGSLVFLLQNEDKDNSQQLREIIEKSKSGDATKFPPHQTSHRAQLEPPPNGGGCLNLPRAAVLTAGKKKSEWDPEGGQRFNGLDGSDCTDNNCWPGSSPGEALWKKSRVWNFLLKSHLEFTQRHVGNSRWPWSGWRFGFWPKMFGHQTRWRLETANSAHHHKRTTSRWSMMAAASSSGDASQQEILQNITKSWRIIPLTQQEDYPLRRRLIFQLEDNHMHAAEAPQKCLETTTRWFWRGRVKAQISVQSRTCVWT